MALFFCQKGTSMEIKLNKAFGANSAADEFDVKQIKKALNKLGYYKPFKKIGITGIPDQAVLDALKSFQTDHNLQPTGRIKPKDDTIEKLNAEIKKIRGKYIWRTTGDEKVRAEHTQLNGNIRDFSDSPDPGDDFNCRCWAEILDDKAPSVIQSLITEIKEKRSWTWADFINHFYTENGKTVTLSETGHLKSIIAVSEREIFPKVLEQVRDLALKIKNGQLHYTTNRSYSFSEASFPIGTAVISSETNGTVKINGNNLIIDAVVTYTFKDTFTDPLSKRQNNSEIKTSDPKHPLFEDNKWTEFGGTYFDITGEWKTKISGSIHRNK